MAFYAKPATSSYTPPPAGLHRAVLVDVVDLGTVERTYNKETKRADMLRLVFQVDKINPKTGKRYIADKRFGNSCHKKATLRATLESWRGRTFNPGEMEKLDLEKLIGKNAFVSITLAPREGGGERIDKMTVMPPPDGMEPIKPLDYTRVQDREGYVPPKHDSDAEVEAGDAAEPAAEDVVDGASDEDVPF